MAIVNEMNCTINNYTEELEEAFYVGTISIAGVEVMYYLACGDLKPLYPQKL